MNDVLKNLAPNAAASAAVTVVNTDWSRVDLSGVTAAQTVSYTTGTPSYMRFKAAYVRTAAGVTNGDVKGVATFTITY